VLREWTDSLRWSSAQEESWLDRSGVSAEEALEARGTPKENSLPVAYISPPITPGGAQLIHVSDLRGNHHAVVCVASPRGFASMYVGFNNGALLIRLNPVQIPARTPRSMGARRRMRWGALVRNARDSRSLAREATRVTPSRLIITRVFFFSLCSWRSSRSAQSTICTIRARDWHANSPRLYRQRSLRGRFPFRPPRRYTWPASRVALCLLLDGGAGPFSVPAAVTELHIFLLEEEKTRSETQLSLAPTADFCRFGNERFLQRRWSRSYLKPIRISDLIDTNGHVIAAQLPPQASPRYLIPLRYESSFLALQDYRKKEIILGSQTGDKIHQPLIGSVSSQSVNIHILRTTAWTLNVCAIELEFEFAVRLFQL